MKTKLSGLAAALAISLLAMTANAHAEITYLRDFPGWEAAVQPDGTIRITRTDRSMVSAYIHLYPLIETPVTSQEEAFSQIEAIKIKVADNFKQCAALKIIEPKNNGMGFEIKDSEKATKCFLFIGGTKQGQLFANLWLDDATFERKKSPYQHTARLFLYLATARINGDEFLKQDGELADLAQFADMVPAEHRPGQMHVMQYDHQEPGLYSDLYAKDRYKAIALLNNYMLSSCSNFDPIYYTPFDLGRVKAKPGAMQETGFCRSFAWKYDSDTKRLSLGEGGEWKPFSTIGYEHTGIALKRFKKGEKFLFIAGSKERLDPLIDDQSDIRSLMPGDVMFMPNGRFLAYDIGLANRPLHLPMNSSGRYYLDGHIIVLELDNGPVLVGFGGKIETDGKVTSLFLGGSAYGEYEQ